MNITRRAAPWTHLLIALLACCALPRLALAQEVEPVKAKLAALAKQATEADDASALFATQAMSRLLAHVPREHAERVYEESARSARSPLAQAALKRERFALALDAPQAEPEAVRASAREQLGCLTRWSVVGPLANPSGEGFQSPQPPERGEGGPYAGATAEVGWRELPPWDDLCALNLAASVKPSSPAVVFLASTLTLKKRADAHLMIGAHGTYRIWLNGQLVAEREQDTGMGLDNEAWRVALRPGENQLLVKLGNDGSGGLDLLMRVTDAKMRPLPGLTSQARWAGVALDDKRALVPAPGALARAKEAASSPKPERALRGAWLWSQRAPRDGATPWREVAERLGGPTRALPAALPDDELTLLAELYDAAWEQRAVLEAAHARAPENPWIALALADALSESLSELERLRATTLLDDVLHSHPLFWPALVALARSLRDRQQGISALRALQDAARDPRAPAALRERLLSAMEEHGDQREARALRAQRFAQSPRRSGHAWMIIRELAASGELDAALAITRQMRAMAPWATHWLLKEVELRRVRGDDTGALELLTDFMRLVPHDTQLMQKQADLLVAMGQPDQAAEVLAQALVHRPQDQGLREHLSYLRPDADRYHEGWMLSDVRERASQIEPGPFHTTTIVDQTIVQVSRNGLSQKVVQRVERANTPQGIDPARTQTIYYQLGDEQADVLSVRVYKADGSVAEDFDTWGSADSRKGTTTYNDNATLTVRANNVKPGDLIEVRYRVSQIANQNFRGDYFGDIHYVQGGTPTALSRYAILYPASWSLYFRPPALKHAREDDRLPDGAPAPQGMRSVSFTLEQVPDVKTDSDQPGFTSVYDYILVSNKKSHDEIGAWWWNLIKAQLIVDDAIRARVKSLTANLTTDEQRVRAIYNYVVQNTRYLHVGLGIHGWKPYRTTTCYRNRFGDCKDKAALLKVMLDEANVPAQLVLVRTRRLGEVDGDIASMHLFNHAITYVPSMDLYLDGTAEFNGARELTPMDQGAQALIVADGGAARWVKLPVAKASENQQDQTLLIDLSGDTPIARGRLIARGDHAPGLREALEDPSRRAETLERQLAATYPGAQLTAHEVSDLKNLDLPVTLAFTFEGGQLVRTRGAQRFFYPLGAPRDLLGDYASSPTRTQPLVLRYPFAMNMAFTYTLPSAAPLTLPPSTDLSTPFGEAKVRYTQQGAQLLVEANYSLTQQTIAASDYPKLRDYLRELTAALGQTITLP